MTPLLRLTGCAVAALVLAAPPARAAAPGEPGFLVVAPDRGFLGNEELRDAFDSFATSRNAQLVFVTDERTRAVGDAALEALKRNGARRVVVLPFFLSRSEPRYLRAAGLLAGTAALPVEWARPYGESYLATEALARRLRAIEGAAGRRLVVVGAGATDEATAEKMRPDWQRVADGAAAGLGFESVRVVVAPGRGGLGPAREAAVAGGPRPVLVSFNLGSKLDGMMSYGAAVSGAAPAGAEVAGGDATPDPSVAQWMAREANRRAALDDGAVGVVLLAHGSDHHWNETMRQALAPLGRRYLVEPAFSMADPVVIERAVRRLEARGARRIVVLRIFALASSFVGQVDRLIGADVERGDPPAAAPPMDHGHGGHGHGSMAPPPRIGSAAFITTVGGLEADPLFARALLERARSLSRDPGRETVVLVAHGEGNDAQNEHWRKLLGALAAQMKAEGGAAFRSIRYGTWREDWPDKRGPAVEEIRGIVQEAARDGGRAIVIPARTLGQGPEKELLQGLTFDLGEGFAPHPLFARWAEEQVASALAAPAPAPAAAATAAR
jgi:sirohydrochlorin ferrochelatase